jgi:purine-binding chemotaxis protein CheW
MDGLFHFRSDNMPYAVHIQHVAQVTWLPELSPFDGGPVWLAGVLNLLGRNVPVIDFARFMGHAARPYTTVQKLLVLQDTARCVALIVDDIDGLQEPAQQVPQQHLDGAAHPDATTNTTHGTPPEGSDVLPLPTMSAHNAPLAIDLSAVLLGQVRHGDGWVMLLNAEKLLEVPLNWPAHGERVALPGASGGPSAARVFKARMHQLAHRPDALDPLATEDTPDAERTPDTPDTPDTHDTPATPGPTPMAIVSTGARAYAVALADITEFTRLQHVSPLPGCAPCIVGCMNLRGEMLSIVDIGSLVGGEPRQHQAQVMVLQHQGHKFACLIDRIDRLVSVSASQVVGMHENDALHPLARSLLRDGDAVTPILNLAGLIALCQGQQALYNPL